MPTVTVEAGVLDATLSTALMLNDATRGKLSSGNTPPGGLWADISAFVSELTIRRGATRIEGPILRYDAGTMSVTLDTSDRRFDPTNLSGPYAGGGTSQVAPMRSVRATAMWAGITYELFRG